MITNLLRGAAAFCLALTPLALPSPTAAATTPAARVAVPEVLPLEDAVGKLPVAEEDRTGYTRDSFRHWNTGLDAGDGCNTRNEVLLAEAVQEPAVAAGCKLSGGKWLSYYDGVEVVEAGKLDIDHTDAHYGWAAACLEEFGQAPVQVCHDWNTVDHVAEYEGRPGRRALTYDELQALFDAADDRVEDIRRRGRKGVLSAWRDAVMLKSVYAYGTRRREAVMLDLHDLRHNPRAKDYGRFGAMEVRFGKASRGSPPKRRTVLTVPEMDWIVPLLEEWTSEVRAGFGAGAHPALWVTERCDRISPRRLDEVFALVRDLAGLEQALELHCLRHTYITHLIEFGYPERFVQDQVGHRYAATTALYTWVSDEYRSRLLEESLHRRAQRAQTRERRRTR
ncbi:tyrosine-type recombinase/integrase [Streptomyces sp. NPDC057235]|uniref:tyrosine-type recombinase/integrase n=1 Tax=Streptomyces sp. NPDC057235 TaxID=3346058 RepID=UPI0036293313